MGVAGELGGTEDDGLGNGLVAVAVGVGVGLAVVVDLLLHAERSTIVAARATEGSVAGRLLRGRLRYAAGGFFHRYDVNSSWVIGQRSRSTT